MSRKKTYVEFDPSEGYPRGFGLFYECQRCGDLLYSMEQSNRWCNCFTLCIDVDAGKLGIQEPSLVRLVSMDDSVD